MGMGRGRATNNNHISTSPQCIPFLPCRRGVEALWGGLVQSNPSSERARKITKQKGKLKEDRHPSSICSRLQRALPDLCFQIQPVRLRIALQPASSRWASRPP